MKKRAVKKKNRLPDHLRIGQMHYHLRPSGVRAVIENTVDTLTQKLNAKKISVFIFSDYENIFSIEDLKIKTKFWNNKKVDIHKVDIPELNYDTKPSKNKTEFYKASYKLKQKIMKNIPLDECTQENPFIFHIHGLPLGKNPLLCAAISLLAEECYVQKYPIWILNQIHDFAENNRPEMIKRLQYCTGKKDKEFASELMYPCTPNVFYATINSRDIENLRTIGINPQRIFFLPNSVDIKFLTEKSIISTKKYRRQLITKLKNYALKNDFTFDEKRKIILSPLKLMRRKNNFESLLLLLAFNNLEDDHQLLITLEARSGKDVDFASKFKEFVKVNKLPVVVSLGTEILSMSEKRKFDGSSVVEFNLVDIFSISQAIITTSIIEGFGFSFIEGWLAGKVIVGRKIPYVCSDFEDNGLNIKHMYKKLWIPIDWIENGKKRLISIYEMTVNNLRKKQGLKLVPRKEVINYIVKFKCKKFDERQYIDFKELNAKMQLEVIQKVLKNKKILLDILLKINPSIAKMYDLIKNKPLKMINHNKKVVKKYYSLEAKAKRLKKLILAGNASYLGEVGSCPVNNNKVVEKYLGLDYIHLLTVE